MGGSKSRRSKIGGGKSIVARCEAVEMETALRDALEKIEQQAVRQRQKTTTIMRHPKVAVKVDAVLPPAGAA
jgi:hypothetical protein